MNCKKIKPLIIDYFDRKIKDEDKYLLLEHINECPFCEAEIIQFEKLDALLKKDTFKLLDSKNLYFENLSDKIAETKRTKEQFTGTGFFAKPLINFAFSSLIIIFLFGLVFYVSFVSYSNEHNTNSFKSQPIEYLETNIISSEPLYENITDENILSSDYFKTDFVLLQNSGIKIFPSVDPIFETYHELPKLTTDEFENIIKKMENEKFI